ncbi:hypothetical protein HBB16_01835 [Pseudonocardia sp. MCCB 268]|nr:hypothetical protein [Pseudonocardia cytotoxica]
MQLTVATTYLARLAELGIESIHERRDRLRTDRRGLRRQQEEGGPTLPTRSCAPTRTSAVDGPRCRAGVGPAAGVLIHVSVGTANAACAVANASRDRVPSSPPGARRPGGRCHRTRPRRSTGRRRCSTRPAWCASSSSGTTSCGTPGRSRTWSTGP